MSEFGQATLWVCAVFATGAVIRIAQRLDVLIWRLEDIRDALRAKPSKESP